MAQTVLKFPVANFQLRKLILGMAGVWPPGIFFVYDLCIQIFLNTQAQRTSETVYEAFNFSLKLLGVFSKQLALPLD